MLNSTFRLINGPKKRTFLYRWLNSNLNKSYEGVSSKYLHFDISHVIISKILTEVCPVYYLPNLMFQPIIDPKSNLFKSMVPIKFGQKLWSYFSKILTFWYQSRVINSHSHVIYNNKNFEIRIGIVNVNCKRLTWKQFK